MAETEAGSPGSLRETISELYDVVQVAPLSLISSSIKRGWPCTGLLHNSPGTIYGYTSVFKSVRHSIA